MQVSDSMNLKVKFIWKQKNKPESQHELMITYALIINFKQQCLSTYIPKYIAKSALYKLVQNNAVHNRITKK